MNRKSRIRIDLCLLLAVSVASFVASRTWGAGAPENLFANPSFELGRSDWGASRAGGTECRFTVDAEEAADGRHSALVTIGSVEGWGVQFGQSFSAGRKGKTYTFAVFAKSEGKPFIADLQIERKAKPWDRAARGKPFRLTSAWQEFHLTFTVEKDFPQGWFAYLSCTQPKVQYRADMFRLYEGPYVPYQDVVRQRTATVAVRLFDTVTPASAPLPGRKLMDRQEWREIPEDDIAHAFRGAAVLMNDRIACVLRRGASGAEIYSMRPGQPKMRAFLAPGGSSEPSTVASWGTVRNAPDSGAVDVVFATAGGTRTLRFELKLGQVFLQTQALDGASSLRVGTPCRFAVMPDFFADDIVIDATDLPVSRADLPSDHLLMHLLPDRQAIVVTVAKAAQEDVRIVLSGEGGTRMIEHSDIPYGKDGTIWVAAMTAPEIWHVHDVLPEHTGRVAPLNWRPPFPAQWRVDWRRNDGLSDSWEMLTERADGKYAKYSVFGDPGTIPANRKRWTTVLGRFQYPCWLDRHGRGHLQPIKHAALRFQGPAVIYPINRTRQTGLDTFTVVDIVRNTLGVGPCEYVLDVEGQRSRYRGRATCAVRDTLNPIYAREQQKEKKAEIEKALEDVMLFIRHIRGRIEAYVAFGHETLDYLAQQKEGHPELGEHLAELEALARVIDAKMAARKAKIATPAKAAKMVEEFRETMLSYDGKDALARCKRFTGGWVKIGGNQDELAGECRWAVKVLRQRAGLLMAMDARMTAVAKEVRRRSQKVLRSPASHEGARH